MTTTDTKGLDATVMQAPVNSDFLIPACKTAIFGNGDG
jgi:hypothetical protein